VTGLSLQGPDVAGKRLELLREVTPNRHRLGILVNVTYPAARANPCREAEGIPIENSPGANSLGC
jgi:hypothetical protein